MVRVQDLEGHFPYTHMPDVLSEWGIWLTSLPMPPLTAMLVALFVFPLLLSSYTVYMETRPPNMIIATILAVFFILNIFLAIPVMRTPTQEDAMDFAMSFAMLAAFDFVARGVLKVKRDAAWCYLHFFSNAVIVYTSYENLLLVLKDPSNAFGPTVRGPIAAGMGQTMMTSLHFYHMAAFPCNLVDFVHHIVSALGTGLLVYVFYYGRFADAASIWTCGIPGGIDYLLLGLMKDGYITKLQEKKANLWLNMALRWPGTFVVLYSGVLSLSALGEQSPLPIVLTAMASTIHGTNGLYFAQRVTKNTGESEYKYRQQLKAAKEEAVAAEAQNGSVAASEGSKKLN